MRRGPSLKRKAEADPLFNSILVSQLTNQVLLDGKKDTARNISFCIFAIGVIYITKVNEIPP